MDRQRVADELRYSDPSEPQAWRQQGVSFFFVFFDWKMCCVVERDVVEWELAASDETGCFDASASFACRECPSATTARAFYRTRRESADEVQIHVEPPVHCFPSLTLTFFLAVKDCLREVSIGAQIRIC
jgi:hypothetical protein